MVFMSMLLGIADFSRALYAYHFVSHAAREAARYAMVRGCSTISTNCPTAGNRSRVLPAFVQNVPLGIDATKVTAYQPLRGHRITIPAAWCRSKCNTPSISCFHSCPSLP